MTVAAALGRIGSGEGRFVAGELDELAYARDRNPQRDHGPGGDREELHRGRKPGVSAPQVRGFVTEHARERVLFARDEKATGKHDPRGEEPNGHRPEVVLLHDGARDAVGPRHASRSGESATQTQPREDGTRGEEGHDGDVGRRRKRVPREGTSRRELHPLPRANP